MKSLTALALIFCAALAEAQVRQGQRQDTNVNVVNASTTEAVPVKCVNPVSGLFESCAGAGGGGGSSPTDTDDGTVVGGQVALLNINLLHLWNGTNWIRAGTDSNDGIHTINGALSVSIDDATTSIGVSVTSSALPAGASTSANQSTEITSLQAIDDLPQVIGSTTTGNPGIIGMGAVTTTAPTYITGGTYPLSLTPGGLLRVDSSSFIQTVTGTVAISQTGTNNDIDISTLPSITGTITANAGTNLNTSALALDATVTNRLPAGSTPANGESNAITTSRLGAFNFIYNGATWDRWTGAITGTVTTTPPANASTNVTQFGGVALATGTGAGGTGIPRVTVSNDSNVIVTPPTLTKSTQGATGFSVQPLSDAGRSRIGFTADRVAPAATDTLVTFTKDVAGTATTAQTTYTVTTGKIFRIQAITIGVVASTTTAVAIRVAIRENTGGTCIATSTPAVMLYSATPAAVAAEGSDGEALAIPDGLEFPAGDSICISAIASTATGTLTVSVIGFEY